MDMTDKEKTDSLIELEKIRIDKYNHTRDLEFKVNIALWTLIVLVGYYYRNTFRIGTTADLVFFILLAIVVVLGHFFFWLNPVSESERRDYSRALSYQKEAEKHMGTEIAPDERNEKEIKRDYLKWNLFLAGITLMLFALLGVFLII
jgi:hypothetical protein